MSYFDYEGFKLAYETSGGALTRPVVIVHGLLLPRLHHKLLAKALTEQGHDVILIDLLGHGESDRPADARYYSMELFGRQVVALLDHLDVPEAVIGGTSLGANVTLEVAVHAPDRVRALWLEMPVLERAAPAAALIFTPLSLAFMQLATPISWVAKRASSIPRGAALYLDVLLEVLSQEPKPSAAVLNGLLTGRIAPHPSDREKIEAPAFVIGHHRDLLHPFSDAETVSRELRNAELVEAESFMELRFPPNRLSRNLGSFLDRVWLGG